MQRRNSLAILGHPRETRLKDFSQSTAICFKSTFRILFRGNEVRQRLSPFPPPLKLTLNNAACISLSTIYPVWLPFGCRLAEEPTCRAIPDSSLQNARNRGATPPPTRIPPPGSGDLEGPGSTWGPPRRCKKCSKKKGKRAGEAWGWQPTRSFSSLPSGHR